MGHEPIYKFDSKKNTLLIKERGISFEEIIAAIKNDSVLDIVKNPNEKKYAHQKMYVVELENYVYLVPFVEENNEIFLKTIFPSRKATKKYLNDMEE